MRRRLSALRPGSLRHHHEDRALVAPAFDRAWYLEANPDVVRSGHDPIDHFLRHGWQEGRDPTRAFSVADYLDAYPDVAASGLNPFVHYLRTGAAEGRSPRSALGFRYQIIARLEPPAVRMAKAAAVNAKVAASPAESLAKALSVFRGGGLHLTFSHDDYIANVGGVQLCLRREAAALAGLSRDHLHLCPAEPWPMIRAGEASLLSVIWNGQNLGAFTPDAVVAAVRALAPGPRSFAIHSLLGHAVDETLAVLAAAGVREGFFWLHDFASLCAGYHLLRDDVADCGAPPPQSPACTICVYGQVRARHLEAHGALFEALALTVVAPSDPALATWKQGWRYPAKAELVLPHAALVAPRPPSDPSPPAGEGRGRPDRRALLPEAAEAGVRPLIRPLRDHLLPQGEKESSGPLRIGFLGWAAPLKGWPIFRDLAIRYADDPRYSFHHIASTTPGGLPIAFEHATPTPDAPAAVRDAVERARIDVALIWPLCRETFSFTAYEAAGGGAAVLTWPDSGNVAAFVESGQGAGRVLPNEAALDALFETGDILKLSRAARAPTLYDLAYSDMTAALIGKPDQ